VVGFVERRVTAGASVDAFVGIVLVVFASKWGFSALLSEDTELFLRCVSHARTTEEEEEYIPLLRTACHSLSER
jgi:hypothetical protein